MGNRTWTKLEINYLQDSWGSVSISGIAKKLNRSVSGIRNKAFKLGLKRFIDQGEYITFNQFISVIGYGGSYNYLEKRLLKLDFPIKYKASIKMKYKIVYINDFWKWVENHKCDISFAKFEENALGLEPAWVKEKRKADQLNPSKINHNRVWTKENDNLLINLTKSCKYTYTDLAKCFNRTENAIKRRLYDLGVPYRPIPRDNHIKWTEEENEKLLELHNKGYDNYAIAKILGKTNLSICDRLKKVK